MFLYILLSEKSHIYYVGITANVSKRLWQHNHSPSSFTSKHRPWILKAAFRCKNKQQAAWCEAYIKQQKSSAFIRELLKPECKHPLLENLERV